MIPGFDESLLTSASPEARSAVISYSRFLAGHGLGPSTAALYTRILSANIPEAADALLGRRDPRSFLSYAWHSTWLCDRPLWNQP